MRIPYAKPSITQIEIEHVQDAVKHGWGENRDFYIEKFENDFAEHLGVAYAIATSSCTGALHMGLSALGIGLGDEVILADSNWIATVAPIVHLGATPIFVDVLTDTWCINPELVAIAITTKTKAIIATHLYGNLANMHELLEIGRRFGIPVIEDAAEAIGSIYFGQRAGSIGKFAVFSFHGSKTITTGEGGMFVTSDAELYERVLTLSNHGRDKNETRMFWPREVGFKYKMSNIQAALGCAQLSRVDDLVRKRQSNLEIYKNALLTLNSVSMNPDQNDCENGAWMPTLIATADQASLKKAFGVLRGNGIDVRPFFAPLSSLKFFGQRSQNKVAERLNNYGLNLPSYFDMEPIEIDFVISGVKQSFRI